MERFRIKILRNTRYDDEYVIQKKYWFGWYNWRQFYNKSNAITYAKELEKRGYSVECPVEIADSLIEELKKKEITWT